MHDLIILKRALKNDVLCVSNIPILIHNYILHTDVRVRTINTRIMHIFNSTF